MNVVTSIGIILILLIFLYFLGLNIKDNNPNIVAKVGISTSLCLILGIVDSYIPSPLAGAKLGLANIMILICLYQYGFKITFFIDLSRVILLSIFKGNLLGMGNMMSLVGALISFLIMAILVKLARNKISIIVISMLGSLGFNLGQILVGYIYLGNIGILYYLPILETIGLFSGIFIGILSKTILRYLSPLKGALKNEQRKRNY